MSLDLSPVVDSGYVNVYGRDVTDQRQMEESLLTAERLAVVGRIAAMMGHDLRGPLVVIRNAVDLARKKPERTDKMLDMIERNAGQAIDILEDLRTRTREDPVSLAPVEIGELLRKAMENILLPDGVELRLEIDDTLPELVLDEAKTMRILDNVIRNAFDAMPAGGVLKIGATREGDKVVIRISDTGPGIPEDTLRNLFKPFYTTKPGGLGLGLTSTKQMVDVQGGTISVETSDGEGATFVIALPLKGMNPGQ
jgi:two-component system sensor histidine kinase PilS (NtrC family)